MIEINGNKLLKKKFPDGTASMLEEEIHVRNDHNTIVWRYESDEELVRLMYAVGHMRDIKRDAVINLIMKYIPNARMDRTKKQSEVFTLKHFCRIINSMEFNSVVVSDPHSDVSVALLNNVVKESIGTHVKTTIKLVEKEMKLEPGKLTVYFPDAGAMKRYKDMECFDGYKLVYGKKTRDWETGKINGLEIMDGTTDNVMEPLFNSGGQHLPIIMVDDIISYGGTMMHSADKLSELGFTDIYAYATHTENSLLDPVKGTFVKRLNSGLVKKLFTTNSIWNSEHPSVVNLNEIDPEFLFRQYDMFSKAN